jgi:hypothetical protein
LHLHVTADSDILLSILIDKLAAEEPDRLFCAYAESAAKSDVLHQITYKAFAWWLQDTLGEGLNFETIAYLGPSDVQPAIHPCGSQSQQEGKMPIMWPIRPPRPMLTRCRPFLFSLAISL